MVIHLPARQINRGVVSFCISVTCIEKFIIYKTMGKIGFTWQTCSNLHFSCKSWYLIFPVGLWPKHKRSVSSDITLQFIVHEETMFVRRSASHKLVVLHTNTNKQSDNASCVARSVTPHSRIYPGS